jgi:hypothetical protein
MHASPGGKVGISFGSFEVEDTVRAAMPSVPPAKPPYDLEKEIVTAFMAARARGKPEWQRMKLAVLKNRLLQITRGSFSESLHGASKFQDVLALLPNLVRVQGDTVELLRADDVPAPSQIADSPRLRVRRDLWDAVMDYAGGRSFVWDEAARVARTARPDEVPLLPTLSKEEMRQWREQFAAGHAGAHNLKDWIEQGLATRALPPELRGTWNRFLRDQVVERLSAWFAQHHIESPTITEEVRQTNSLDELRKLVTSCVAVMTEEELAELKLSPSVFLRAQQHGHGP